MKSPVSLRLCHPQAVRLNRLEVYTALTALRVRTVYEAAQTKPPSTSATWVGLMCFNRRLPTWSGEQQTHGESGTSRFRFSAVGLTQYIHGHSGGRAVIFVQLATCTASTHSRSSEASFGALFPIRPSNSRAWRSVAEICRPTVPTRQK